MPSLLELLIKGSAPPPPPKKPDNPLAKSLLLLSGVPPHTLDDKPAVELWTPEERELFLPPQDIGGSLPDLRTSAMQAAKPPTLYEQAAQFGKAIQSIPETISGIADAVQGVPKAAAEMGAGLRTLGITIARGLDWLERHLPQGPLDPYGRPVPRWNLRLYLLAYRAYQGDLQAKVTFLDEIEADNATDNPTYIQALLQPTFAPKKLANRENWEQLTPDEARQHLRKRLKSLRYEQNRPQATRVDVSDVEHLLEAPPHPECNPDLLAFAKNERAALWLEQAQEMLPEKLGEVFAYLADGLPLEEIARRRNRSLGCIKKQVWAIHHNPHLRAAGESWRQELWREQP